MNLTKMKILILLLVLIIHAHAQSLIDDQEKNLLNIQSKQVNLRSDSEDFIGQITQQDTVRMKQGSIFAQIFSGFVIGPILFFLSFGIIWYNEKRQAINSKRLKKIHEMLQTAQPKKLQSSTQSTQPATLQESAQTQPSSRPKPSLLTEAGSQGQIYQRLIPAQSSNSSSSSPPWVNSNLMHLTGKPIIKSPAEDPIAKIKNQKGLRIDRWVQVLEYRVQGNKKKKKRQHAELQWCIFHISEAAGMYNKGENWFMRTETFIAHDVTLLGYQMSDDQMKAILGGEKIPPSMQIASTIKQSMKLPNKPMMDNEYMYFPTIEGNMQSPGTLRVKYMITKPDTISVICSNEGRKLVPFRIDYYENNGKPDTLMCQQTPCCGACNFIGHLLMPISQVNLVSVGTKNVPVMIQQNLKISQTITTILRIVGYFVMVFGIYMLFDPIVQIIGYIPFVGGIFANVIGFAVFLAAMLVCIPVYLAVISIAWLVYRPIIGLVLILISCAIAGLVIGINAACQANKS